jgi:heme oxygenase
MEGLLAPLRIERPRHALRERTADRHRAAEAALTLGAEPTVARYRRLLRVVVEALGPVEAELEVAPTTWAPPPRTRQALDDLHVLGDPTAVPPRHPPLGRTEAEMLGMAYVVAGAAHGARVLLRQVEALGAPVPTTYLSSASLAAWPALVGAIDRSLVDPRALDVAVASAAAVFDDVVRVAGRLDG